MNTKLLILITFLESTDAFLASNGWGKQRVFGLNRPIRATSAKVTDPAVPELSSPPERSVVNVDHHLLGNRASEWFMPRIGGLTSADISSQNQVEDVEATSRNLRNPIQDISSAQEFDDFFSASDDEGLNLVLFHANYCKTCQRFKLRYEKIAHLYGDSLDPKDGSVVEQGKVRLASVEHTANIDLCESLNVNSFPSVHFYKGTNKIHEMTVPLEKFEQVQKAVEDYLENKELASSSLFDDEDITKALLRGEELMGKVLNDSTSFASN